MVRREQRTMSEVKRERCVLGVHRRRPGHGPGIEDGNGSQSRHAAAWIVQGMLPGRSELEVLWAC